VLLGSLVHRRLSTQHTLNTGRLSTTGKALKEATDALHSSQAAFAHERAALVDAALGSLQHMRLHHHAHSRGRAMAGVQFSNNVPRIDEALSSPTDGALDGAPRLAALLSPRHLKLPPSPHGKLPPPAGRKASRTVDEAGGTHAASEPPAPEPALAPALAPRYVSTEQQQPPLPRPAAAAQQAALRAQVSARSHSSGSNIAARSPHEAQRSPPAHTLTPSARALAKQRFGSADEADDGAGYGANVRLAWTAGAASGLSRPSPLDVPPSPSPADRRQSLPRVDAKPVMVLARQPSERSPLTRASEGRRQS
jgi:hypothetical protein